MMPIAFTLKSTAPVTERDNPTMASTLKPSNEVQSSRQVDDFDNPTEQLLSRTYKGHALTKQKTEIDKLETELGASKE